MVSVPFSITPSIYNSGSLWLEVEMIELELDVDGPGKLRRVTEQYYL